ncbi:hypothetical protein L9F63_023055, partial [Diploptera punctata]
GYGCFSGYIMSMFVLYLLQNRRINGTMSSYQVARSTWSAIAKSNWTEDGISLAQPASQQSGVSDFHKYFDVVFLDVTGCYNLCANMCRETYIWPRSVLIIQISTVSKPLFMTRMPFYRQFDHIIRRGLQQRVFSLGILFPNISRWSVNEAIPSAEEHITLGLTLNPEFAFSTVERGPGANLPEFWNAKTDARLFQDGSICEAFMWNIGSTTLQQRRLICRHIVCYLLQKKLGIHTESSLLYVADQLEPLLERHSIQPAGFEYGTGEEASVRVISVVDALSKQLRQVEDIPLEVTGIRATSAVMRYCEVLPPLAMLPKTHKYHPESRENCHVLKMDNPTAIAPRFIPVIEGVIQLGMSGKWPQNLAAIQRIKAAFYIQTAQGLSKQFKLTVQPYPNCIHIFKDGFTLSLEVAHQREISLLKEYKTPEGMTKYRDTPESIALEKRILHLPKLSSALHGLHQQFPGFGPTCCLAKRWLSSQLIDPSHFPEMCTELLVASLFLSPEPYHPPNQPQLGFFRFLNLMANTDWNTEPVILNLNDELNREDILKIENWFQKNRVTLPNLFLSTPYDKNNSIWSKEAPSLQILIRVAMLARESLRIVESLLFYSRQIDSSQIFRPPLDAYDVIIHLIPKLNPLRHEAVDATAVKKNKQLPAYKQEPEEKIPVAGFNPVSCYLHELRRTLVKMHCSSMDVYGGDMIAVLWKPPALQPKGFR